MRRYKIVACILLILSVSSFVPAAPVAVQEVRKVGTDAVDGGDKFTVGLFRNEESALHAVKVMIGSGKRAEEEPEPNPDPEPESSPSSQLQGSTSTPNYASRTRPNPSLSSSSSSQLQGSTSTPNYASRTRPNRPFSPEGAQARPRRLIMPKNFYEFAFSLMGRPKFWRD